MMQDIDAEGLSSFRWVDHGRVSRCLGKGQKTILAEQIFQFFVHIKVTVNSSDKTK